ncbi:MAG TPA: pilus assembly protein TadE [Clostridia bacterium]|nr:pilus assembly protein TadE [Clostridia bacterium]
MTGFSKCKKLALAETGAAMVEFTLIIGLTLMILFSAIEFGLLFNTQLVLANAARVGARRASIDGGATQEVYEKINQQLVFGKIDPSRVDIYISPFTAPFGQRIHLRLAYTYRPSTPFLKVLAADGIPLKSEVFARSEKVW